MKFDEGPGVKLRYLSRDGEEGYPGNLNVKATYVLTEDNEFKFSFGATTDRSTVVNITSHNYYNLARGNDTVLDHQLTVIADRFVPVDEESIPTGEFRSVKGTPFDFRELKTIGEQINSESDQLRYPGGYDHSFVLNDGLGLDTELYSPSSGILMALETDQPGIQVYSANHLEEETTGSGALLMALNLLSVSNPVTSRTPRTSRVFLIR